MSDRVPDGPEDWDIDRRRGQGQQEAAAAERSQELLESGGRRGWNGVSLQQSEKVSFT